MSRPMVATPMVATAEESFKLQARARQLFDEFVQVWGRNLAKAMAVDKNLKEAGKVSSAVSKAFGKLLPTSVDRQILERLEETSILTQCLNGSRFLSSFLPMDSVCGGHDSIVKKFDLTSVLLGCVVRVVSSKFGFIDITISSALLDTSLAQGFVVELRGEVVAPHVGLLEPDSGELGVFKVVSGGSTNSVIYRSNYRVDGEASITKFGAGATAFLGDGGRKLKELGFVTQPNNAAANMCQWLSVVQSLAHKAGGESAGILPPVSVPGSQPVDDSEVNVSLAEMGVLQDFTSSMARALRSQVLSFVTTPLALLSILFQMAFKAVDVEENVLLKGGIPGLAGSSKESRLEAIRNVVFACMVAILGIEHVDEIRALSFFVGGTTLATKLSAPTPLESAIADHIAELLNNRSASVVRDQEFAGVEGVRRAWLQVVDTSFKDGQFAGLEAVQFTAFFLQLAQVATLRTLEPKALNPGIPVYCVHQTDNLPSVPGGPLPLILLALDHRIVGHGHIGSQYGHYEHASFVGGDAAIRRWSVDSPQLRRMKELLGNVMTTLRDDRFSPVSGSAASASAVGCSVCGQPFDKVVSSQVKCVSCSLKVKNDGPKRICAIGGGTCDMSSVLPTNAACDKCTAALKLSADQRKEAAKKELAARDKEAQKLAAAAAEKLDAAFKLKQAALEKERLLARDRLLHPGKLVLNCSNCNAMFVQKSKQHEICTVCHVAKGVNGVDVVSAAPKVDSIKTGQKTGPPQGPPQVPTAKSFNQAGSSLKPGVRPPSTSSRVNRATLAQAVERRVASMDKRRGAVLKAQVQAAIDKEVSSKRILEALEAGNCLSCDKCEHPHCKLKHPNDPASSTRASPPHRAAPQSRPSTQRGGTAPVAKAVVGTPGSSLTITFAEKVKTSGASPVPQPPVQQPKTPPSPPPAFAFSPAQLSLLISSMVPAIMAQMAGGVSAP